MKDMFFSKLYAVIGFIARDIFTTFATGRIALVVFFVLLILGFGFALQGNKKKLDKNFLINMVKSSMPAVISLIAGVAVMLLALAFGGDLAKIGSFEENRQYIASMAVIAFALAAFSALIVVSLPLNKMRLIIIFSLLLITIIILFVLNIALPRPIDFLYLALSLLIATFTNLRLRKMLYRRQSK